MMKCAVSSALSLNPSSLCNLKGGVNLNLITPSSMSMVMQTSRFSWLFGCCVRLKMKEYSHFLLIFTELQHRTAWYFVSQTRRRLLFSTQLNGLTCWTNAAVSSALSDTVCGLNLDGCWSVFFPLSSLFAVHTPPEVPLVSSSHLPLLPPLKVKWHFHFQIASYSFVNRIELLWKGLIDSF